MHNSLISTEITVDIDKEMNHYRISMHETSKVDLLAWLLVRTNHHNCSLDISLEGSMQIIVSMLDAINFVCSAHSHTHFYKVYSDKITHQNISNQFNACGWKLATLLSWFQFETGCKGQLILYILYLLEEKETKKFFKIP